MKNAIEVLREFVADVDAIGGAQALGEAGDNFWPDLLVTYNNAKAVLADAHSYSLAEIRNGTGWNKGTRFIPVEVA